MRSHFQMALESGDSTDSVSTYSTGSTEEHHQLMNESLGLENDIIDANHDMEKDGKDVEELMVGSEEVQEVQEVVQEAYHKGGLSKEALHLLTKTMSGIVGKRYAAQAVPAHESYERYDKREVTRVALEGIKETLKQFWGAIKGQVTKFWNTTKQWWIKTFDGSKKIISRAKALDERANNLSGTPTEKNFEMSGTGFIQVNYTLKNPKDNIDAFAGLYKLLEVTHKSLDKANSNDKSDQLLNKVNEGIRKARSNATNGGGLFNDDNIGNLIVGSYSEEIPDFSEFAKPVQNEDLNKNLGIDPQTTQVLESNHLPGNRTLFITGPTSDNPDTGSADGISRYVDSIKLYRFTLGETAYKSKETQDELTVPVLASGQMSAIASICEDVGNLVFKYKTEFEARDKYFNRIVKGYDTMIKELDGTPVQNDIKDGSNDNQNNNNSNNGGNQNSNNGNNNSGNNNQNQNQGNNSNQNGNNQGNPAQESADDNTSPANSSVDKEVKKLANASLGLFKKVISLNGALITHTMKVAAAFLTYGERSLQQYSN